jgi:hypothetical protein
MLMPALKLDKPLPLNPNEKTKARDVTWARSLVLALGRLARRPGGRKG